MRRPLLLGHRGVRAFGPSLLGSDLPVENTLAAFEYALAQGCDGFEFDVRHTRDGRNVLWHDPEYKGSTIAESDYAELAAQHGTGLASFEDMLRQFVARAYLDIELKVGGRESSIVAALHACAPQCGFLVSSFLPDVLAKLREFSFELPIGFICDRRDALALWRGVDIQVLLPHHSLVHPMLVAEVHERGLQIMTWTVNSAARMRELAGWGIDGIISDDPGLMYQTFHPR